MITDPSADIEKKNHRLDSYQYTKIPREGSIRCNPNSSELVSIIIFLVALNLHSKIKKNYQIDYESIGANSCVHAHISSVNRKLQEKSSFHKYFILCWKQNISL